MSAIVRTGQRSLMRHARQPDRVQPRVWLPPGAGVRPSERWTTCGPWLMDGTALAIVHRPESGAIQRLGIAPPSDPQSSPRVSSAELGGLDPAEPLVLHPRPLGLGLRDTYGGYRWCLAHSAGEAPWPSQSEDGAAPPGDPVDRWNHESLCPSGRVHVALEHLEGDARLWRYGLGDRQAQTQELGLPLAPIEQRAGRQLRLGSPRDLAFSPHGGTLAIADRQGVLIWDWRIERLERRFDHPGANRVAWSKRGWIASAGRGNTVRVWDLEGREPLRLELELPASRVLSLAFSPEGWLAAGGPDGVLCAWDLNVERPERMMLAGHDGDVLALDFLPGGLLASGGEDAMIGLWTPHVDGAGPQRFPDRRGAVRSLAFLGDHHLVSSEGGTILRTWEVFGSPKIWESRKTAWGPVCAIAVSRAETLATGGEDGVVRLWSQPVYEPRHVALHGHAGPIRALAWGDDQLASCGEDDRVCVWHPSYRPPLETSLQGRVQWVSAMAFAPDGRLVSTGHDKVLRLWDVAFPEPRHRAVHGHPTAVRAMAFEADGSLITEGEDRMLRRWNLDKPEPSRADEETDLPPNCRADPRQRTGEQLPGRAPDATAIATAPDGLLATAGVDGAIRLWNPHGPRPRPWQPLPPLVELRDKEVVLAIDSFLDPMPEARLPEGVTWGDAPSPMSPYRVPWLLRDTDWCAVTDAQWRRWGFRDAPRGTDRVVEQGDLLAGLEGGILHLWTEHGGEPDWLGSVCAGADLVRWSPRNEDEGGTTLQGSRFVAVQVTLPATMLEDEPLARPTQTELTGRLEAVQGMLTVEGRRLCKLERPTRCIRLPMGHGWLAGGADGSLGFLDPTLSLGLRLQLQDADGEPVSGGVHALATRAVEDSPHRLEGIAWLEGHAAPWSFPLPRYLAATVTDDHGARPRIIESTAPPSLLGGE